MKHSTSPFFCSLNVRSPFALIHSVFTVHQPLVFTTLKAFIIHLTHIHCSVFCLCIVIWSSKVNESIFITRTKRGKKTHTQEWKEIFILHQRYDFELKSIGIMNCENPKKTSVYSTSTSED